MEDIKVGDYIRAKFGVITQIETIKDTVVWTNEFIDIFHRYNEGIIEKRDIIKHSPNITDLIEIGDFVEIIADGQPLRCEVDEFDYKNKLKDIGEEIIVKSIVTKEQFNSIKYKLEE